MTDQSLLHKGRKLHSRIFITLLVFVVLFTKPAVGRGVAYNLMWWFGYALVIAGVFGRVFASVFIGGRKNTTVVRQGPFSVVRNPLYVSSFVAAAGCALQSGSFTIVLAVLGSFALYYPKVVAAEEAHLSQLFGEEYDRYVKEVPRWVPDMALWQMPEFAECKPVFVLKCIRDALVFFLPMPVIALVGYLHNKKMLWVWFQLP